MKNRKKAWLTRKHIVLEILGWLCMAAAFAVCLWTIRTSDGEIALHFDSSGNADRYGSPSEMLLLPVIMSAVMLLISLITHLAPLESFHLPSGIKPKQQNRIMDHVCTMMFLLSLEMALYTLCTLLVWNSGTKACAVVLLCAVSVTVGYEYMQARRESRKKK